MSKTKAKTSSGLDDAGTWTPAFEGQRPPFRPGHQLSVGNRGPTRHGAYATVALSKKAADTADILRELMPVASESDEPALQMFAMTIERLKAAERALEQAKRPQDKLRLSADARGWALTALRFAESFGLTPRSRVALGLDLVRGEAARLTVTRLAALAEEEDRDA